MSICFFVEATLLDCLVNLRVFQWLLFRTCLWLLLPSFSSYKITDCSAGKQTDRTVGNASDRIFWEADQITEGHSPLAMISYTAQREPRRLLFIRALAFIFLLYKISIHKLYMMLYIYLYVRVWVCVCVCIYIYIYMRKNERQKCFYCSWVLEAKWNDLQV